jgi:hypothetical protein
MLEKRSNSLQRKTQFSLSNPKNPNSSRYLELPYQLPNMAGVSHCETSRGSYCTPYAVAFAGIFGNPDCFYRDIIIPAEWGKSNKSPTSYLSKSRARTPLIHPHLSSSSPPPPFPRKQTSAITLSRSAASRLRLSTTAPPFGRIAIRSTVRGSCPLEFQEHRQHTQ